MAIGVIKKFIEERGFGFIQPDGSRSDIFFHKSALHGAAVPEVGAVVEFVEEMTPNGRIRAATVRPI
jgi:cold shock CspA family protein